MAVHEEHVTYCTRIFVPWKWLAAITASMVIGIIGVSGIYAAKLATLEERTAVNTVSITKLQRMEEKIDKIILRLGEY